MQIYWWEQTEADLPTGDHWLSPSEVARRNTMRFVKRRNDWRLGRWTAKSALALYLKVPADPQVLASIEIRAAPSGAPEVYFQNKPAAATISLSHRAGIGACAVTGSMECWDVIWKPLSRAATHFSLIISPPRSNCSLPAPPPGPPSALGSALEREGERAQSVAHRLATRYPFGDGRAHRRATRRKRKSKRACRRSSLLRWIIGSLQWLAAVACALRGRSSFQWLVATHSEPHANSGCASASGAADSSGHSSILWLKRSSSYLLFNFYREYRANL